MYNHYMFQCLLSIILLFRHLIADISYELPLYPGKEDKVFMTSRTLPEQDIMVPTGNAIKTQYRALIHLSING